MLESARKSMTTREHNLTEAAGLFEVVLSRHQLPGLLIHLARQSSTGKLTLVDGAKTRVLTFVDGLPTSAGSWVHSERLGPRLSKLNLLSPEQEAQVDAVMQRDNLRFGAAMLKLGMISEVELRRTLMAHHNWILSHCLNATQVRATFTPCAWLPPDSSGLALLQGIEDGVRAWGASEVSALVAEVRKSSFEVTSDDLELARRLGSSKGLLRSLQRLLGGPRNIDEIVAACEDDGDPEVQAITLVLCGLVQPADGYPEASYPFYFAPGSMHSTKRAARRISPIAMAAVVGVGLLLVALLVAIWPTARVATTTTTQPAPPAADEDTLAMDAYEPALLAAPPFGKVEALDLPSLDELLGQSTDAASAASAEDERAPPPKHAERGASTETSHRSKRAAASSAHHNDASVQASLRNCSLLIKRKSFREALNACQQVLKIEPRHALAYRQLGIAYASLGARPQACESYRRYLRFANNPPDRQQVVAILQACTK